MADNSFFTLSSGGGGLHPDSLCSSPNGSDSSLPLDSSPASSVSIVSATTHDTSRTKYHIDELSTFAQRLEDAAASVFPNRDRCRYKDVQVLLLRWEQDDMGVGWELDDLAKTLKKAYGFNTETWLIPNTQPHLALMGKAFKIVQDFGKKDNLLIVYYAGHGGMNTSRQPLWHCSSHPNSPSLQWYAVQTIFEQAESDTLLLLDCCAAASGAPADGQRSSVTETIAACGFETWAPQPGRHSFTNTLIAVLEEWCNSPGFTAAMLHCEVLNRLRHEKPERKGKMKKFECRRTPVHILSTADARAGSVELQRRGRNDANSAETGSQEVATSRKERNDDTNFLSNDKEVPSADPSKKDAQSLYDPDSLTKVLGDSGTALPQVLISLALEEEQLLDIDLCLRWLHQFPALAKYAKVQGVYRGNSTLLILSLPVLIWDWIPDDPACSFIGYVHSSNLLASGREPLSATGAADAKAKPLSPVSYPLSEGFDGVNPEAAYRAAAYPLQALRAEDEELSTIQSFRQRVRSLGSGSEAAWTVHVSFLPTSSQPFPFEKDTVAYKRCLSRGLDQIIVVPNSDGHSFKAAIDQAFFSIIRGRPWGPLVARICDAKNLRGLPMLRQLPMHLIGSEYNAEFLQHNCAVVDESGKILDLYIALSEDTISWAELREVSPFIPSLEASWAWDPFLDGPAVHETGREEPNSSRPAAGGIIPSWPSPCLKRPSSAMPSPTESSSAVESDAASRSKQRLKPGNDTSSKRPRLPNSSLLESM